MFDNAHLMKTRIYARDRDFSSVRTSLALHLKAKKKGQEVEELGANIEEGKMKNRREKERSAEHWNACVERFE